MNITLDGKLIEVSNSSSILEMLDDTDKSLKTRPLAAQIGGKIYSLRNIPSPDSTITLLRYSSVEGRRVYERTLQFVFLAAVESLFEDAGVTVAYTLGSGLYITIDNVGRLTDELVALIKNKMLDIIHAATPLIKKRIPTEKAAEYFSKKDKSDKSQLIKWRRHTYYTVYCMDDYMDYCYGEMAPDTSYASVFDIKLLDNALLLLAPDRSNPDTVSKYVHQPKLAAVFNETESWSTLMKCSTASELNMHIENGTINELVRINEALHEKRYANIADMIASKKVRAVLLAGPSSSGKTTSANRISTQLRAMGLNPVMISMDDYYKNRSDMVPDENGRYDFEHINTLDTARFNSDLALLLKGQETETPLFDFTTGCRKKEGRIIKLKNDEPLIIEGIHALNPMLISSEINNDQLFRIYVSALTTLNLDKHNRIRTTDVRLLRRLVRDNSTRSTPVEQTLEMWPSVRRGEERWIFPHQENADVFLNTTLIYEIAVLKKYIFPLLSRVDKANTYYVNARNLLKFLSYFKDADIEREIPPTSILREFIGGNTFYR